MYKGCSCRNLLFYLCHVIMSLKFDDLEGPAEIFKLEHQGLGIRYSERMNKNKEKLHQVDGTTGFTETNGSVRNRAMLLAIQLKTRNYKSTDVIAICSKQHAEQTVTVLGILLAGHIVAPINIDLSFTEGYDYIDKMRPKLIFCDLRVVGIIEKVLSELKRQTSNCQIITYGGRHGRVTYFEDFLKGRPDPNFHPTIVKNPKEKVAFILQTQGTTGNPKLVCLSHYFIFVQTRLFLGLFVNLERMISFFPLSNFLQTVLTCVSFEEPVVRVLPGIFAERTATMLIHDLRIDHAILGTDYALRLCSHPAFQDFDNSCLQCILIGCVAATGGTVNYLRQWMPRVKLLQVYDVTEVGLISGFAETEHNKAVEKPDATGKLMPSIKIRIVGPDSSENLGPDMWGQLLVKSSTMMLGYLKNEELNSFCTEKGYFKTGDIGQYDEDGFLYVQGSVDDRVTIDGESFVPSCIEEVIVSHPFVVEAVVIGNGHDLVACVVKKSDCNLYEDKLRAYMADRLSENKIPTSIKFVSSLPKTSSGKVKKYELRNAVFNVRTKQSDSVTVVN